MQTLLNWEILHISYYSAPVMIVGFLMILAGIVVFFREHASTLGAWYLAFSAAVGVYCIGAGISYAVTVPALALSWERMAHVGVALIPGSYFLLTSLILGKRDRYRRISRVIMAISICFALFAGFSGLMVSSNRLLYWGFYPLYGPLGLLNILYFILIMLICYYLYLQEYRASRALLHRRRLRGMMIALGIGYIGAVDFLPVLGIKVFAFGYIPIFLFVAINGAVILRYRLVDITPELAASQILHTMQSAVLVTDLEGTVRVANDIACRLLAPDGDPLLELPLTSFLRLPEDQQACTDFEIVVHEETGQPVTLNLSSSALKDRRGLQVGTVFVAHDISARKESEQKLRQMALHDSLTGLPNRILLFDRIHHQISLANRNTTRLAVLYMDLDHFKAVNDRYGHALGDEVLLETVARLKQCVRESDTLARVGGDEFIGLCGELRSPEGAKLVAEKIVESLSEPFTLSTATISIGVSIGISIYPADTENVDDLLSLADTAMYKVKQSGRGGLLLWTPELKPHEPGLT
jgi:diguanylate cyclase (GGDEF)-like protein